MADVENARPIVTWKAARTAGLKRYYTGIPCKRGHVAERHTSNGTCMTCSAEKALKYHYDNHKARLAKLATYRGTNKDKIRAGRRAYYAANGEKVRRDSAAYFKANRKVELQKRAAHRTANKALYAAWDEAYRLANPEKVLVVKRRYRARRRGAAGDHTGAQIKAMLLQQGHRCANCKTSIRKGYHADHIVPLKLGGSNDISNIQLLCRGCNCSKGGKDPFIWAQEMGRLL
jgi:5-methylcytosine-specific restriction endonuclease McrA